MRILDILDELAEHGSRLDKEAILKRERNNKLLQAVFSAAYDPSINYYIRKIPPHDSEVEKQSLEWGLGCLDSLADRTYTGNEAVDYLRNVLEKVSKADAEVLERVIDRDLRCGATDSTANKIWPGLIPTFDVMLCRKDTTKIVFPAIAQTKADALRCHLVFNGKKATAFSRNGKPIELHGRLDKDAAAIMEKGETLDGELVFYKDGKPLPRKVSNGIGNKGVKGTISEAEADLVRFMAWDIVDQSSTIPYEKRFADLRSRLAKAPKGRIILIHTEIVNDEGEAQAFYRARRKAGEEGAILKNLKGVWVPKRTNDQGKMKAVEEADLRVVSWENGEPGTKYEKYLGALTCETEDGKLRVSVGSGFSDEERKTLKPKDVLGKVVAVLYNEIITSKGKTTKSLFLPRFVEIRFDKDKANTLDELK